MKYLKIYEDFTEINNLCASYCIRDVTINKDGTVDVNNDVDLSRRSLIELPFKFGKVEGCFDCSFNKLTTLFGGPKQVNYDYLCNDNKLINVEWFPEYFDYEIWIFNNPVDELISLVVEGTGVMNDDDDDGVINYKNIRKFIKYLNEYDVIRDGLKVVEMRLEEAYWIVMKKELSKRKRVFKNYQLI